MASAKETDRKRADPSTGDEPAGGHGGRRRGLDADEPVAEPGPVDASDLAIGIDFGGSGIKGALVDVRTGNLAGRRIRVPTPQPSVPREVVSVMGELVDQVAKSYQGPGVDSLPVGVGIPSATRAGAPLTAANIDQDWIGFPAEKELSLTTRRVVAVGNDADVAGLAEVRFGAGRGHPGVVIVLTIGTGIGSGLFVDGRLVPNTELGHVELRGKDAELRVSDAARDRLRLSWKEWAGGFDEYLRLLEKLFWPDLFILGGGASKRTDHFLSYISVKTPVVPAELRNNAGIVGGALIAHERLGLAALAEAGEPFA